MGYEDTVWIKINKGRETFGDVLTLFEHSKEKSVIVELGTAMGMGSCILSHDNAKVYTVDCYCDKNFPNYNKYETIKDYLALYGVIAINNYTADEAENWEDNSVDLLFIDAGHNYENVRDDYFAWITKVKVGGTIIFHDMIPLHGGVWDFYKDDIHAEVTKGRLEEVKNNLLLDRHFTVTKVFRKCKN